eukprot:766402-Hanusia_phi.AAC.2
MSHAATPLAFYIFLWSYIFIVFFILFNIFLAILVDAYATVKQATEGATGLVEEVADVVWHAVRKVLPLGTKYMSDEEFHTLLKEERAKIGKASKVQSEVNRKLEDKKEILLRGGVRLDVNGLQRLLERKAGKGSKQVTPVGEDGEKHDRTYGMVDGYGNDMVLDVMERYGSNVLEQRERRNQEFKELVGIENMRRLLVMNMLQIGVLDEQRRMSTMLESMAMQSLGKLPEAEKSMLKRLEDFLRKVGTVTVTILGASDLPRMDLIRSCDPYCVAYIDGSGEPETFVTETFAKNTNPRWNQEFSWEMYSDTNFLTVSVWDRDNVTKDDLVGTAIVDLKEFDPSKNNMELTLSLTNARKAKKVRNSKLHIKVCIERHGVEGFSAHANGSDGVNGTNGTNGHHEAVLIMEAE